MKIDTKNVVIGILIVAVLVFAGYIVYDKWVDRDVGIFQQGAQYGYEQAVLQIMQQASKCEAVPVYAQGGNVTLNLVAVECLQQAQEQSAKK